LDLFYTLAAFFYKGGYFFVFTKKNLDDIVLEYPFINSNQNKKIDKSRLLAI